MVLRGLVEEEKEDEAAQLIDDNRDGDGDGNDELETVTLDHPPVHPIPSMQGAFEESIYESTHDENHKRSRRPWEKGDAVARRRCLLEAARYKDTEHYTWGRSPGAKWHPLWKLMAQIAFGVHLLQQRLAKSDEEVVKILHTHVNDVDTFLERTGEDLDLALDDISERIKYLKLPLKHGDLFDAMLDDKKFRTSIIEGNDKIEHVMSRTEKATRDGMHHVAKGMEATTELSRYVDSLGGNWTDGDEELSGIYTAMRGNAEGWFRCGRKLQQKANALSSALVRLGEIVNEMAKRAGAASRRSRQYATQFPATTQSRIASPPPASRYSLLAPSNKALPHDPSGSSSCSPHAQSRAEARSTSHPESRAGPRTQSQNESHLRHAEAVSVDDRFERPRQQPQPPVRNSTPLKKAPMVPREPQSPSKPQTTELVSFLNDSTTPDEQEPPETSHADSNPGPLKGFGNKRNTTDNSEPVSSPSTMADSAYYSGSDKDKPTSSGSLTALPKRPTPNLGLFPKESPMTPSVASTRSTLLLSKPLSIESYPAPSVSTSGRRTPSSNPLKKKSSLASLKKVFQWKLRKSSQTNGLANVHE